MQLLAQDVADVVRALEELMFARKRDREELSTFGVMLAGFAGACGPDPSSPSSATRAMLEDLLVKTQVAREFVRAEAARHADQGDGAEDLAALELVALIEAIGVRLSALPAAANGDRQRELPALLLC